MSNKNSVVKLPPKCKAKKHGSDQYVIGYYVYLEQGNTHHWIITGGTGNGGWCMPHRHYIQIDTLEILNNNGGNGNA